MAATTRESLQLFDLPLELQRLIFERCFDQDWKVHAVRRSYGPRTEITQAKCSANPSQDVPSEENQTNVVFKFDVPLGLFLVNRHFNQEGRRAMAMSRRGTYYIYDASDNLNSMSTFWDSAITCLNATESDYLRIPLVESWKQRFPNLSTITNGKSTCLDSPYAGLFISSRHLEDLMSSKCDHEVATLAEMDFEQFTGRPEALPNLSIVWTYSLNIKAYGKPRWWLTPEVEQILEPLATLLKSRQDLWLHTTFSINRQRCRLIERYFTFNNDRLDRHAELDDAMGIVLAKGRAT